MSSQSEEVAALLLQVRELCERLRRPFYEWNSSRRSFDLTFRSASKSQFVKVYQHCLTALQKAYFDCRIPSHEGGITHSLLSYRNDVDSLNVPKAVLYFPLLCLQYKVDESLAWNYGLGPFCILLLERAAESDFFRGFYAL